MNKQAKISSIFRELAEHFPFTFFGALTGIILILVLRNIPSKIAYRIFYILHPAHVFLSAMVTASIYSLHKCGVIKGKYSLFALLLIGYLGSIGIATLSDSLIPYWSEALLEMPQRHAHIGFIEEWWLVNPLAILGIAIAYFRPSTKFPHAGHILISTWASIFHFLMAKGIGLDWRSYLAIFFFLLIAVWLPCCFSDIVFPLLFVDKDLKETQSKNH